MFRECRGRALIVHRGAVCMVILLHVSGRVALCHGVQSVLSINFGHDCTMVAMQRGIPKVVVPLKAACSANCQNAFFRHIKATYHQILKATGLAFDVGAHPRPHKRWATECQIAKLRRMVPVRTWVTYDHHMAHAASGLYDSPFRRALVLVADASGHGDTQFKVYLATRDPATNQEPFRVLLESTLNIGLSWAVMSACVPAVNTENAQYPFVERCKRITPQSIQRLVHYTAHGTVRQAWLPQMVQFVEHTRHAWSGKRDVERTVQRLSQLVNALNLTDSADWQDLARNYQRAVEHVVADRLAGVLRNVSLPSQCQGLVVTGGLGFNIQLNAHLYALTGLPVHVPPHPGDACQAIGGAWLVQPPAVPGPLLHTLRSQRLQAAGGCLAEESPAAVAKLLAQDVVGLQYSEDLPAPDPTWTRALVAVPTAAMHYRALRLAGSPLYAVPQLLVPNGTLPQVFAPVAPVDSWGSFAREVRAALQPTCPGLFAARGMVRPFVVPEGSWMGGLVRASLAHVGTPVLLVVPVEAPRALRHRKRSDAGAVRFFRVGRCSGTETESAADAVSAD